MPVEIRELVIQTHIVSNPRAAETLSHEKLQLLKQQIMEECLKALKDKAQRNGFDR